MGFGVFHVADRIETRIVRRWEEVTKSLLHLIVEAVSLEDASTSMPCANASVLTIDRGRHCFFQPILLCIVL
jgi:hypothetical protein